MKFITLTNIYNKHSPKPVRINVEMIGHYSPVTEELGYGGTKTYTSVGVLTHNNGGFQVEETPEQIDKLIEEKFGSIK